jgi:hypothetical protein
MADAPEIKVKLTAEDAGVAAAIKELGAQLKNLKTQQDETAASGLNLAKAFNAITAGVALVGLARIGKEAFDSAVNIGKMADKTGLTTQTLSVFHKVADDVGVSTEAVDKGLTKAAKSITEFQAGSVAAAKGFQLLGITQKDFLGLNPDQKIGLVTTKLGGMKAGLEKTAAAQLIFSRGGAEMIVVANAIAAQGMDKATEATARLGLLLDQTTTDSFRSAKASMQELTDAAQGMATQFEAGVLPALTDTTDGLLDALGDKGAGGSFNELGKTVGNVIRGITFGLESVGISMGHAAAQIEEQFSYAFNHAKEAVVSFATFVESSVLKSIGADQTAAQIEQLGNQEQAAKEHNARMAAIEKDGADQQQKLYENVFPSDEEEKRRAAARLARLRPEKQDSQGGQLQETALSDAAAKAQLALELKQGDDELAVHRAYAAQTAEVDKQMYDAGLISLAEYFDRRKVAITTDAAEEVAILAKNLAQAQAAVQTAAEAKAKAATPKDADKQEAARLTALQKVDELQTKITEIQVSSSTKIAALDAEQFAKTIENDRNIAEIEKQLATTQKDRVKAAQEEVAVKTREYQLALQQRGTDSPTQINAKVAALRQAITAQAEFDQAQKKTEEDQKSFELAKQQIEIQAKAAHKSPLETEREINQLLKERLPLLQADANAELSAAGKTGNQDDVAAAQNAQQNVQNARASMKSLGSDLGGAVGQDFTSFFENIGKGTRSVADAFRGLASSVVASIEQILVKMLLLKIGEQAAGAFSPGSFGASFFGALGGGHAEGGLIHGPGGPKDDRIRARLSAGEFVVKADAVRSFGAYNLDMINRGLKVPSIARLAPAYAEGGLVSSARVGGNGVGDSNINLGISLDEGLVLKHLGSKAAGRVILQQLSNNPKAAAKALSRSQ